MPSPQTDLASILSQLPERGLFKYEPIGGQASADIVISCGIHGNETAPIELCLELISEIQSGQWQPNQRVLFLFGNIPAIAAEQRFIGVNLNRLFSGAYRDGDTPEHQRAEELVRLVSEFYAAGQGTRYHYDLHTAIRDSQYEKFAIYPFTHGAPLNANQLAFLASSGIDTVLLAHEPSSTFSCFSAHQHGAHAFTVELGKVHPFGENDLGRLADLKRNLIALMQGRDSWQAEPLPIRLFQATREIPRLSERFALNFPDDTPNFTAFPLGAELASDQEQSYWVEQEGEAIVFPNAKVQLGHRALLMVRPVGLEDVLID